jgi:hypothetical protein
MKLTGIKITGAKVSKAGKIETFKRRQSVSANIAAKKRPKQRWRAAK